jgi:signal transduction histidine kinase
MEQLPPPASWRDSPWRSSLLLGAAACLGAAGATWYLLEASASTQVPVPLSPYAVTALFGLALLCAVLALLRPRRPFERGESAVGDGGRERAAARSQEERAAANVAHELRTPLAAIKIHAQVALHAGSEAERRAALERTLKAIDQAAHLMQQLLVLSRVDGVARLAAQSQPLQLPAVARRVVEELRPFAAGRGQVFAESFARADIDGVEFAVSVLVRNLIDNAMRYGPQQGTIRVGTGGDAGGAWVAIEDAGPGIPAEHRQLVFERFQRLAADDDGSGIGLSIVRSVAQLHGASIELGDSDLGGLKVTVRFPALAQASPARLARSDPALRPTS